MYQVPVQYRYIYISYVPGTCTVQIYISYVPGTCTVQAYISYVPGTCNGISENRFPLSLSGRKQRG